MTGAPFARMPKRAMADQKLAGRAWRVLTCLCWHANGSGEAWPSLATISRETGIAKPAVPREINRLIVAGYVYKLGFRPGYARSRTYRVLFDDPGSSQEMPPSPSPPMTGDHLPRQAGVTATDDPGSSQEMPKQTQGTESRNRSESADALSTRVGARDADWQKRFAEWWAEYPHKVAEPAARAAYRRALARASP